MIVDSVLPDLYKELEPNTRDFVLERTQQIRELSVNAVQSTIQTGEYLREVKESLGHGKFLNWLEFEFGWAERTARNFMAVADLVSKSANFADLPFEQSALYVLSAPSTPEEAVSQAVEEAENGEIITHKRAKEIVGYWKDSNKPSPPSLITGTFDVIYADPPWQYDNQIESWGPTSLHYPTMPLHDIKAMSEEGKIPAADDATLFMWVTNPFLQDAFEVVEAWGFEYKTNIVWVKTNLKRPGSGFYVRGRHELLFICTKGKHVPDQKGKEPIGSVVEADIDEHSRKPEVFYEIIEKMYPDSSYLELFARRKRDGWESWGNEV